MGRALLVLVFIFLCVASWEPPGPLVRSARRLWSGFDYVTLFALWMTLAHIFIGLALIGPFLFFGLVHLATARKRMNRVAVRLGIVLFVISIVVGLTGLALIQIAGLPPLPTETLARNAVLAAHILTPLAAVLVYVLHRRAGPAIHWNWGVYWGVSVGAFILVMGAMHSFDPRKATRGSPEGEVLSVKGAHGRRTLSLRANDGRVLPQVP